MSMRDACVVKFFLSYNIQEIKMTSDEDKGGDDNVASFGPAAPHVPFHQDSSLW